MTTMRMLMALGVAGAGVLVLATQAERAALAASGETAAASRDAAAELACAPDGRGFRELVELVRARAAELDRWEGALRARERDLVAVREAASAEIARLEAIAKHLGIAAVDGGVSIAKVYESMDPEDVAPLLDRLDDVTLRVVLGRMREKQVGAILAAMTPERAVAVTRVFAAEPLPAR